MVVGTLKIQINLHAIASIKDKRKVVKSLIERLQSRFRCAAAEIDAQDSKLIARIGAVIVANDGHFAHQQLERIAEFIRQDGRFVAARIEPEVFSVD